MGTRGPLATARTAYAGRAWDAACAAYDAAGRRPLPAADLEAWGLAELMTGHDARSAGLRERAHHCYLRSGDLDGAARVAFWLGLSLLMRGEVAQASGWFARPRSLLGSDFATSAWAGYERLNRGMAALMSREEDRALALLGEALEVARQHDDPDLRLLAGSGHGQALLALGRPSAAMTELDEVMVLATTGDASPQAVGQVYCAVIAVCRACLDLTRGAEWTAALTRWCADQPGLVPYRGQCLVHRSEVLTVRGQWDAATREVERLLTSRDPDARDAATGMALYQRGELHRLRGEFRAAEHAYREAVAAGHDPQPGLALLRVAQGREAAALQALRRALEETRLVFARVRLLPAAVDVAVAAGDLDTARAAAAELAEEAGRRDSAHLRAVADTAQGVVALAQGDLAAALSALRPALRHWEELDAPYDAARCRVLLARACRELGDTDTADLECDAAHRAFTSLGARHDAGLLRGGTPGPGAPAGLTGRELEVLRLVATGASNREIAGRLVLSERTVARHVANIFLKIDVSARAAATAYAYDHDLV